MPTFDNSVHCPDCDTSFSDWGLFYNHEAECPDCYSEMCPQRIQSEHRTTCGDCDREFICGRGCRCYDTDPRTIFNYSYRPVLQFHGTGDYFLGVELEISADRMNATPIYDWANANDVPGLFFCKEDGSVEGFEIVTHPMTPEFFESVDWDGFFDMLNREYPTNRQGNREPVGHGIHVHVSRTAFPNVLTLARWAFLVNKHADHVQRIARRAGSNWARFTDRPVANVLTQAAQRVTDPRNMYDGWGARPQRQLEIPVYQCGNDCGGWHSPATSETPCSCGMPGCPERVPESPGHFPEAFETYGGYCRIIDYRYEPNPEYEAWQARMRRPDHSIHGLFRRHREGQYLERYQALNLTNSETVEVRVFRSTRRPNEFRDAIRTVYTSVEYVRSMQHSHTTGIRDALSWASYVAFVAKRYETLYPTVAGMDVGNPNRRIRPRDAQGRFTAMRDNGFTSIAA